MSKEKETRKKGTNSTSTKSNSTKSKNASSKEPDYEDALSKIRGLNYDAIDEQTLEKALEQMGNKMATLLERDEARRPTPNPLMSVSLILSLLDDLEIVRMVLQYHAANNRPLDRQRLNGVGIKKQGFIDRAYSFAQENQVFLPRFLTLEKFSGDFEYFNALRKFHEMLVQLREFTWNLVVQAADVTYTDALEYYAVVREGSQRRIDGAESIHRELEVFFRRTQNETEEPTKKEVEMDVRGLLDHKHDGKVVIENISPKVTGGVHKVVDEKFTGSEQFKESVEGEIKE